jgi:hypothetical protein
MKLPKMRVWVLNFHQLVRPIRHMNENKSTVINKLTISCKSK